MKDDKLTDKLLDAIGDLLIENQAYETALKVLEDVLPDAAYQRVRAHIAAVKSDPQIRATVQQRLAQLKGQSPADTLQGLLRHLPPKKDVN